MSTTASSPSADEKAESLLVISSSSNPTQLLSPAELYATLDATPAHSLPLATLFSLLHSHPITGLSPSTLPPHLLSLHGPNSPPTLSPLPTYFSTLLQELREPLILLLLLLSLLYFLLGQLDEALLVSALILLCLLIEVAVEWRAKRAVAALTSSATHTLPCSSPAPLPSSTSPPPTFVPGDVSTSPPAWPSPRTPPPLLHLARRRTKPHSQGRPSPP